MRTAAIFCAAMLAALVVWSLFWTGFTSFVMWQFSWPGMWVPFQRFMFGSVGLVFAFVVAAIAAEASQ
jgi:hypothetical protein